MEIVSHPRQTENKWPVDPLYRCLALRDDRLKMPGRCQSPRQQLESRWAGSLDRDAFAAGGEPIPEIIYPPPASGKAAPHLVPAQHLHVKGRRSRGRTLSCPGPGWVPSQGSFLPSQSFLLMKGTCCLPVFTWGEFFKRPLGNSAFSLVGQQLTTTLISVTPQGLSLSFLALLASELTFDLY